MRGATLREIAIAALICLVAVALAPARSFALELRSIEQAAADYRNPNEHLQEMFRAALLDTSRLARVRARRYRLH